MSHLDAITRAAIGGWVGVVYNPKDPRVVAECWHRHRSDTVALRCAKRMVRVLEEEAKNDKHRREMSARQYRLDHPDPIGLDC